MPPADHLLIERRDRGQFVPSWRRRNPPCRDPGLHQSCVSQRRSSNANSLQARIRWIPATMRPFKEIICVDISEFESSHPSHAVWSLWAMSGLRNYAQERPAVKFSLHHKVTFNLRVQTTAYVESAKAFWSVWREREASARGRKAPVAAPGAMRPPGDGFWLSLKQSAAAVVTSREGSQSSRRVTFITHRGNGSS